MAHDVYHKFRLVDVAPPHTATERAMPLLIQLARIAEQRRELEEEWAALGRARDQIVDALAKVATPI